MENQTTIFDMLYPKKKITKPIRLIELFGGYGSQALALKYLGVKFEHWKLVEWAVKSIKAYKDIHFNNDNTNYSIDLTKEEIIDYLNEKGISNNYNEPMFKAQIQRLNEATLRGIYNDIQITHNLVNIQQAKGEDLEIVDTDKYEYIMTYSFPCQDLSLAGKGKGMSDTSTRSGMLWEVERILTECENKPQILLMENVPQVHSEDNLPDFNKWKDRLEELGYKNYFQDLIATDYGIPQTRNRTFMVSLLGDYSYTFPKPIPLKLKLKDMLEDNVDEKYYLSEKGMQYICGNALNKELKDHIDRSKAKLNKEIAYTINTKQDRRCGDANFILDGYGETTIEDFLKMKEEVINTFDEYNHKINGNETIGTIQAMYPLTNHGHRLIIKNATSKGYLEATDGDGIDISSRMEYHRGTVQKGKTRTLTTMGGENNGVVVIGNYSPSNHNASRIVDSNYSTPTVMENYGTITAIKEKPKVLGGIGEKKSNGGTQWYQQNRIYDDKVSISITTELNPYYKTDLRIRKLTPRECFRLMGVKDEDFDKVAKNQSDSSLYHLAGDSIVVDVIQAIIKELL